MKKVIITTSISVENTEVYNIVAGNIQLHKSNDFNLLKCFKGNRVGCLEQLESEEFTDTEKQTFISRVNKLRPIIREKGFDKNFPILVVKIKGVLYIVDGQGRYTACQIENIPFYYTILEGDFDSIEKAIAYAMRMNCLQTPWRSSDKYRAACIMYNKLRLLETMTAFNKKYSISNNNILMLLFGQNACKRATFDENRIKNEEVSDLSYNLLQMVCELRKLTYEKAVRKVGLTKSKKLLNEKYVHSFAKQLRKNANLDFEKFSDKVVNWWYMSDAHKVNRNTTQMTEIFDNL